MTAVAVGAARIIRLYRPLVRRAARRALGGRRLDPAGTGPHRWTDRDVDAFVAATWRRLPALLPPAQLAELPTWGNRHNVLLAAITTAAYQELRGRGLDRDLAAEWVGDVGWVVYAWGLRAVAGPLRLLGRDPDRRMARALRGLMVFPFSAPGRPGYEVELWTDAAGVHTHWTWCPPQAFVRRVVEVHGDDGELDAFRRSWCGYDWPGADLLAGEGRRGHYTRTRTLSAGDAVCDMCWRGRPVASDGHVAAPTVGSRP